MGSGFIKTKTLNLCFHIFHLPDHSFKRVHVLRYKYWRPHSDFIYLLLTSSEHYSAFNCIKSVMYNMRKKCLLHQLITPLCGLLPFCRHRVLSPDHPESCPGIWTLLLRLPPLPLQSLYHSGKKTKKNYCSGPSFRGTVCLQTLY